MLDRDYGSARGRAHCWRTHPGRAAATASSSSGLLRSAWGSSWTWPRSGSATSPSSLPSPSALARRWEGWMLLSALIWANEKVENQVRQIIIFQYFSYLFHISYFLDSPAEKTRSTTLMGLSEPRLDFISSGIGRFFKESNLIILKKYLIQYCGCQT